MGSLAAIAGMVTMARLNSANLRQVQTLEMDAIGACFIGGSHLWRNRTVPGLLALLMGVLNLV